MYERVNDTVQYSPVSYSVDFEELHPSIVKTCLNQLTLRLNTI